MRSILFVCTANICRSPTAEGVLRRMLIGKARLTDFRIESAGTHDYHEGKPPFPTAVEVAKRRGYDITLCIARRIEQADFDRYDLILAMDRGILSTLHTVAPTRCRQKMELLTEYSEKHHQEDVPDPYGSDVRAFELAMDIIEDACMGLAGILKQQLRHPDRAFRG